MHRVTPYFLSMLIASACPTSAEWIHSQSQDRLDGSTQHLISLVATETIIQEHRRTPDNRHSAKFILGCVSGKPIIAFTVQQKLIAGHDSLVSYRIDQSPPIKNVKWGRSPDNSQVGLWDVTLIAQLFGKLGAANDLLFRVSDDVFGSTDATFKLGGMQAAYKEHLKDHCRFQL